MIDLYSEQIAEFYESVGYGALVLFVPTFAFTLVVATVLSLALRSGRLRVGAGLSFAFIFAFALVGAVSGAIAGATLESIVGASLAAILGLVSSLLAYLFGKQGLRAWRPVIPLAIIALLISTLAGLVIGGSRRAQILANNEERAAARFHTEQVVEPVEREERILLLRKCIADAPDYEAAFEKCASDTDK